MPATITFHANGVNTTALGDGDIIDHNPSNASNKRGLGFYGLSHGLSVPVGSCQDTTFVTSEDGTVNTAQLHNTKYVSTGTASSVAGTVSVDGAGAVSVENLPNHLCPLNIRFQNDDAVRVQECELRIFDKANIENAASGVTTYVYEARHPSADQSLLALKHRGRATNDHTWAEFNTANGGSGIVMTSSPGASGLNTNDQDTGGTQGTTTSTGINHTSTRHDWYVALAAKPESIGSKQDYALYFTLEYLA